MEHAVVQPADVPVPLRALDFIIHDWTVYCEDRYSVFVRGLPHDCTQDSCELFSAAYQFYGCRVCGNHHVCRRQVCSAEQIREVEQQVTSLDALKRELGIAYGYWCPVDEREPGLFLCRISGHGVRSVPQRQADIQQGFMLRDNANHALLGTVTGRRVFQKGSQGKAATNLSTGALTMRPERHLDATALSYHASQPLEPDGDGDGESNMQTEDAPRDVLSNVTLMNALSRTSSPDMDRKHATDYFETLTELVHLHISTFQGAPSDCEAPEPPFKRPSSAPLPTRPVLPPIQNVSHAEGEALQSHIHATVRAAVTRVHAYWAQHAEIDQEARERTYDLERTLRFCVPLLWRLLRLFLRYRERLRCIQQANTVHSRRGPQRQTPSAIPGVPRLIPQSAVWINIEEHVLALLLRGFCEPMRLRDVIFGEVHELWPADPFLAEAASHGVLDECEPEYVQGVRYVTWVHWALSVLDFTAATVQDELWPDVSF